LQHWPQIIRAKQGEWNARDFVFHTDVPIRLAAAEVSEPIHLPPEP
jgi:hypothetical protein